MTPDIQHLKAEIIAGLDLLSTDSLKLIAKFVSFLRTNTAQTEIKAVNDLIEVYPPRPVVYVASPRLLHPHQAHDFQKEVVEIEQW